MDQFGRRAGHRLTRRRVRPASVAWLAALGLFAADTDEALRYRYLPPDLALERWVQSVNWGPLAELMDATNWTTGMRQAALAVVVVALVGAGLGLGRALLLIVGSAASLWETLLKVLVHRPRPSPALVHVQGYNSGYSYPSGHATFYAWLLLLVAAVVTPFVPRRWRPLLWALALAVIVTAGLGRVWAGAHWPTDVAGGFLLSALWSAAVLAAAGTSPAVRVRRALDHVWRPRFRVAENTRATPPSVEAG